MVPISEIIKKIGFLKSPFPTSPRLPTKSKHVTSSLELALGLLTLSTTLDRQNEAGPSRTGQDSYRCLPQLKVMCSTKGIKGRHVISPPSGLMENKHLGNRPVLIDTMTKMGQHDGAADVTVETADEATSATDGKQLQRSLSPSPGGCAPTREVDDAGAADAAVFEVHTVTSPAPTLGVFGPPAARPGSDSSALMEGPLLWAAAGTSGAHCVVLSVDGATALHSTVSYPADKIGATAASPPARPRHLYPASADYIFSR
ncbi:unnamed protein product [Arctogadus glacialis]